MIPALTGSLAAIGLLAGWPQRALIARLAIPLAPPPPEAEAARVRTAPPASVRTPPPALVAGCVTAVLLGTPIEDRIES